MRHLLQIFVTCSTGMLLLATLSSDQVKAQDVIFVGENTSGVEDGASWGTSFNHLQDALAVATAANEIWIEGGLYRPDEGQNVAAQNREISFKIPWGVKVYGGFDGTESDVSDRSGDETILSGDLLENDSDNIVTSDPTRQDNAYQVVRIDSSGAGMLLNGLVIRDGNANDQSLHTNGGGLFAIRSKGLKLIDITFEHNTALGSGGAMYVGGGGDGKFEANNLIFINNFSGLHGGGAHTVSVDLFLKNSEFVNNVAEHGGGGLYSVLFDSNANLNDLIFDSNKAGFAGGFYGGHGSIILQNSIFVGNEVEWEAGGIGLYDTFDISIANVMVSGNKTTSMAGTSRGGGGIGMFENGSATLTNVSFSNNSSVSGPASIRSFYTDAEFNNVIVRPDTDGEVARFEGNTPPRVGHSIIQGGLPAFSEDLGGNLVADPMYVNPLGNDGIAGTRDDDLRLSEGSPAIDTGDNSKIPNDLLDLDHDMDVSEPLPVDFDFAHRVHNGTVDMGAFEFNSPPIDTGAEGPKDGLDRSGSLRPYPNPATDWFRLEPDDIRGCVQRLRVTDSLGRVVLSRSFSRCRLPNDHIDISSLPSGYYFVQLVLSGSTNTTRSGHVIIVN